MKAIRLVSYGGPEALVLSDIPVPQPGPGQVLVKLEYAGVNFVDIYQRTGAYSVSLPATLGSEGAGVIDALGAGVTGFTLGERVAFAMQPGAYAEYCVTPAEQLVAVPERVDLSIAAAVMLQGMTAHYLTYSSYLLQEKDVAVAHAAAGGVGLLLTQIAKKRGATVIGTVSTEEKADLARKAGADYVVNYTRHNFAEETLRLTDGLGAHVVYDSVGKTTFDGSLQSLRPRGYLVLFGQSSGAVPPLDLQVLNARGSLFVTRPSLKHYIQTRDELLWRANDLFGWIAAGELDVRIDSIYPLEQAGKAQEALASRGTKGKVLLKMS